MTRIVHCKTWWDSHDWNYRAAESVQRKPSEGARDSRDSTHRARQDLAQLKPPGRGLGVHGLLKGCICPAEAAREGWQDLHDSRHRVR